MRRFVLLLFAVILITQAHAQNTTDVSLFMRSDSLQQNEISAESGDLYKTIGHHGPAVENEWMALRIYFSDKAAIDVYSKAKAQLELKEKTWYPTAEDQKTGWGADYYKVGQTVGLGGVRLWDGEKVVKLNPVSNRTARVVKEPTCSYMEMLSEDVPYKGRNVDVLVRVTVYSGERNAKVEAFALTDEPVQFVTGVNYHKGQEIYKKDGLIATWGLHPEDVAAELVEIGAAIIYNPADYVQTEDDGTQFLLISKPGKQLTTWVSSACGREAEINTMKKFIDFLEK
ncbi:protein of unknown function [Draconibacterium orientale]|uniref:DUF4861 domain-containing protein n=1 Tax=Draconibacterium orientale TaxID=1168034 RepID=X5DTV7_9BACT|nr:DUF4861 family protein [Draconibacterium orientale]AHW58610.1 hypothetical protein FH5T_00880 [Draconibacterium orientale]SET31316.1 protein of unknown function [Draconibacterium orientale]